MPHETKQQQKMSARGAVDAMRMLLPNVPVAFRNATQEQPYFRPMACMPEGAAGAA
jgi:hypothetical protein